MDFIEISPNDITDNTFKLIADDWMLLTAGTIDSYNCMTASWGGFGVLWFKPVVFVFIRPQRYTHNFFETNNYFTLTFFDESYRNTLQFCGKHSGRTVNKAKECNIHPFKTLHNSVAFSEAKLVIECKKLYSNSLQESSFLEKEHLRHYANKDFHTMYIGEIVSCLKK
ncbi:MAG TPA: flavin reductase [Bacteroidales bacterium]|nr:flavin reductase [Bacteroidales bacterium]